ncbi:MAG: DnaJ domain-containing protein [Pseudomonadota bacterium]
MAARLFLALVAVIALMWFLAWYNKASPAQRNKSLRSILLYGAGAAVLLLVVTGRIPWLFAIFSAAVPWINRAMAARRVWQSFRRNSTDSSSTSSKGTPASPGSAMSHEEAYEILGLEPGASDEDIISAHRKLMLKIHPDRGGNDYLASRINKAKDVLLG